MGHVKQLYEVEGDSSKESTPSRERSVVKNNCMPRLKPGLHIVVKVAEHACDASKRILKPSTHRLKIFLVKYQNL